MRILQRHCSKHTTFAASAAASAVNVTTACLVSCGLPVAKHATAAAAGNLLLIQATMSTGAVYARTTSR